MSLTIATSTTAIHKFHRKDNTATMAHTCSQSAHQGKTNRRQKLASQTNFHTALRAFTVAANIIMTIWAGDLLKALADPNIGLDGVIAELLIPNINDKYILPRIINLCIPCALYLYEMIFILNYRKEQPVVLHHIVSGLVAVFSEMSTCGALLNSLCFFLSDCAALPMFVLDFKGKVLPTAFVAINYTVFRIPLLVTIWRFCVLVATTPAGNNMWMVAQAGLAPLMVGYSLLSLYKMWKLLIVKTILPQLRTSVRRGKKLA